MTIQDFFFAYEGTWAESNKTTDQTTIDQCIDLWRIYNRKIVKAPDIFGNPPDIWNNYQSQYYDRILNTPDNFPKLGDVVIWGTKYGTYGHIAICVEGDVNGFTSFDQNDPLKSPCHFQPHKYTGVLGWLRPKNIDISLSDHSVPLQVITEAYNQLLDADPLKQGNLEGYVRQIVDEHKNYKEFESKSKQLDGFVEKWVQEFHLTVGSNLVEIENEMTKLLPAEDSLNKLRDSIEKAVGKEYTNDESLIIALSAIENERITLTEQLSVCQAKLQKQNVWKSFVIGNYVFKIYKGGE